jgi:hypothetical protein
MMRSITLRDGEEALEDWPVDFADDLGAEEGAPAIFGDGEREMVDEAASVFNAGCDGVGGGEGYALEMVIEGASARVRSRLIPGATLYRKTRFKEAKDLR